MHTTSVYGSKDSDPTQNVTDPEHWLGDKIVTGTIDAPCEAAEESLECVVVKEADWPLLTLLLPALPTIPVVGGLFKTQSVKRQ